MRWILQVTEFGSIGDNSRICKYWNLPVKPLTCYTIHAVAGGRRVHLQFIAALNPFRSTQCMPDSQYTRPGSCVHGCALILLNGVRTAK